MSKLDLKYRPSRFSDVLGNDGVRKLLLKRSFDRTLAGQSMMFGGPKGCGKTSMARIVARAILCGDLKEGEPCGECQTCRAILDDVCDSVEEMDAASQGTVDRVRSMVQEADYGTLDGGDQHVYIIDEAQRLSKAAQDALLKAVESRLFIVILCTTEPQNIKGPIRDRVEEYPVYPPPADVLLRRLEYVCKVESIPADKSALSMVIEVNGRTPRSCLLALDALSALGGVSEENVRSYFRFDSYSLVNGVLRLLDSDPVGAISVLDELSGKESPAWIRDALVLAIASGLRSEIGAKPTFPVQTDFFGIRGRAWTDLARDLGRMDRPSIADLEACLLASSAGLSVPRIQPQAPSRAEPAPSPPPPPDPVKSDPEPAPAPAPDPVPDPKPVQAKPPEKDPPKKAPEPKVQVDGVSFSRAESLTSLDSKIVPRSDQDQGGSLDEVPVRLDDSRAPLTEKEFVHDFLGRFRTIR